MVWRVHAAGLALHVRQGAADQVQTNSLAFPSLASADLLPFLVQVGQI